MSPCRFCSSLIDKYVKADQKREQEQEGEMHRNHDHLRNVGLWVVQGVLAALFLFAGGMKLITPVEVLTLMSAGCTNVQIATRLHITERTVRKHLSAAYEKAHVPSRAAAATWWMRHRDDFTP